MPVPGVKRQPMPERAGRNPDVVGGNGLPLAAQLADDLGEVFGRGIVMRDEMNPW